MVEKQKRDNTVAPKAQLSHHKMLNQFLHSCTRGCKELTDFGAIKFLDVFRQTEDEVFGFLITPPHRTRKRNMEDRKYSEDQSDLVRHLGHLDVYSRLHPTEHLRTLFTLEFLQRNDLRLQDGKDLF